VHNMLTYERKVVPSELGASMFSVGEIYPRLKAFRAILQKQGLAHHQLYFVKVDVSTCFDSIPQEKLLTLIERIVTKDRYYIKKHDEIRPPETHRIGQAQNRKPRRKFPRIARPSEVVEPNDYGPEEHVAKDTIFVDGVVSKTHTKRDLLFLLQQHIRDNVVKIGTKYYKQKKGIPQGSVISSLACNYFYAEMERDVFSFIDNSKGMLFRMVDDSLFITTDKDQAVRFSEVAHTPHGEYGFKVNIRKSLANFALPPNAKPVPVHPQAHFPYCGLLISTVDLSISRSGETNRLDNPYDNLTISLAHNPGHGFHNKVLQAFKTQAQPMIFDTRFNKHQALANVYECFAQTAEKFILHAQGLGKQIPTTEVMIRVIKGLFNLAGVLMKGTRKGGIDYRCDITDSQIQWLICHAFRGTLRKKQTRFAEVINWLQCMEMKVQPTRRAELAVLKSASFRNHVTV
jgi:telomerase reverse transcriptase